MEPVSVSAVAAAAGAAGFALRFFDRVTAPIADELGEWGRDKVREFRNRNIENVSGRAASMVQAAGAEVLRPVSPKILFPLLEGASRESESELIEAWAALLANASIQNNARIVLPIFPTFLGQLSPLDARVLAWLATDDAHDYLPPGESDAHGWHVNQEMIAKTVSADTEEIAVTLDTLVGLGLLAREPAIRVDSDGRGVLTDSTGIRISELGQRFVAAVTAPAANVG